MRKIKNIVAVAFVIGLIFCTGAGSSFMQPIAGYCYNTHSEIRGNVRICYYNCGGAEMYITIDMFSTCPFTINI